MDITGKVAIVTGSARGIGKGYAEALLEKGAKVVLSDILVELGLETELAFKQRYGEETVVFTEGDVTNQDSMENVFDTALKTFGQLDILINNAGIAAFHPPQLTFDVNVFSIFRCCDLAVKHMSKDTGGSGGVIVNIASSAGIQIFDGCPMYLSSKHAVVGYSGALGKKLANGSSGIRCVALCPGFVKTSLTQKTIEFEKNGNERVLQLLKNHGGWTKLEDVTSACMRIIENEDISGGSLVQINSQGMQLMHMNDMPAQDV